MTRARTTRRITAVAATILAVGVNACRHEVIASKAPVPVRTAMVQSIAVSNGTKYSASIVPYSQVDLAFQSSGYVDRVRQVANPGGGLRSVDQGDWVSKGTVLAVVRQQTYRDKLDQAKAQLSRAAAEYEKARLSFERVSALYATKSATKPDYDSAKAQVESTAASVAGAKAQINEAQVALNDCSLEAPFDGWIVKRSVDVGSFVGPATNGFTLASTRTVKAVFGIPDTLISQVKKGQNMTVATDAFTKQFFGHVTTVSPSADPKSRVFSVEVTLNNPRNELKPGMIASIALEGEPLSGSVLAIPLSAVLRDPNRAEGFAVMIADGDANHESAHLRPVELGEVYGNMIAAAKGLHSGEQVITAGATMLRSGDAIRVIP